jgi:P27 family predicted phage terminase small subunit
VAIRGPKPKPIGDLAPWTAKYKRDGEDLKHIEGELVRPDCLDDHGLSVWDDVIATVNPDLLQPRDRDALLRYCFFQGQFVKASEMIRLLPENELVAERAHPLFSHAKKMSEEAHKIGLEFGFTPSSRARVPAPAASGGKKQGKERFFAG